MHLKLRIIILLIIFASCAGTALAVQVHDRVDPSVPISAQTDSMDTGRILSKADSAAVLDSVAFSKMPWYEQLMTNGFRIHDPEVKYPKFPRFLLKVYDWGDRTFNSYDSAYVVGVGKNWKVTLKNLNWMESYMMLFSLKENEMLHIRSDIYCDVGAYVSFMALSVGYTAKINDFLGGGKKDRRNLNFNFTCSRLFANFDMMSTTGNTVITRFGQYNDGKDIHFKFNDVKHSSVSGEAFYIFNYSQYSHAAAYCYSKYQLKGAGSWLLGFAFNNQNIHFDFSNLPADMKEFLPELSEQYHYRYTDYGICGGYAHNWVMKPRKWLANLTLFPSLGYRHSYHDSTDSRRHLLSTSLRARFAFVYNHKALFASLTGRLDTNLHFNSKFTFFNAVESLALIVGARF